VLKYVILFEGRLGHCVPQSATVSTFAGASRPVGRDALWRKTISSTRRPRSYAGEIPQAAVARRAEEACGHVLHRITASLRRLTIDLSIVVMPRV
jgi:hypothetical protein